LTVDHSNTNRNNKFNIKSHFLSNIIVLLQNTSYYHKSKSFFFISNRIGFIDAKENIDISQTDVINAFASVKWMPK
jgi:hypothetical protein